MCPLSEGVLSGLYHFPLVSGNVLLTLEASFQALLQCCNIVGKTGQVHAVINPAVVSEAQLGFLRRWYRNIWFVETKGTPYDPVVDRAHQLRLRASLIHGSDDTKSVLHNLRNETEILSTIFSYMGTFPTSPITTVINRIPPHLKDPFTSSSLSRVYADYFNKHVRPITSHLAQRQSSFWMMGCYHLDDSLSADQCGETLIRIQSAAACTSSESSFIKPKEQLRIGSLMVLISKFKKSWTLGPPPPLQTSLDDNETIRSAIASICGGLDIEDNTSSIGTVPPPVFAAGSVSELNARDAAMSVLLSHSNKTLGGPFADTLRSLAEDLLLNSSTAPAYQATTAPLLSTLLQTPPGQALGGEFGAAPSLSTQASPVPQLPRFLLEDILG